MDQPQEILQRLLKLHPRSIDLSLERMERILEAIGNPEKHLPPVFHVAGTNGKGSTVAFLRAFLEASGYTTHTYTSPHLVNFNERIRLGRQQIGKLVSNTELAKALNYCEEANQGKQITFFEITTAAALHLFASHPADALILEVGLGGRLDATNVVEDVEISIITSISLDHEQWLGENLTDIAFEKAGVMKCESPVVIAPQTDEVLEILTSHAKRVGAPAIIGGRDFVAYEENKRLVFQNKERLMDLPLPALQGRHQLENAALAIAALGASKFWSNEPAIEKGIRSVSWPARMQRISEGPLLELCPENCELWLDGGHNPGAGIAMAKLFADLNEMQSRPLYLISGMLNTKNPCGYFDAFRGLARQVVTMPINSTESSRTPENLAEFVRSVGLQCDCAPTLRQALSIVSKLSRDSETPPRILIGGSLYLAGEALAENGYLPV